MSTPMQTFMTKEKLGQYICLPERKIMRLMRPDDSYNADYVSGLIIQLAKTRKALASIHGLDNNDQINNFIASQTISRSSL